MRFGLFSGVIVIAALTHDYIFAEEIGIFQKPPGTWWVLPIMHDDGSTDYVAQAHWIDGFIAVSCSKGFPQIIVISPTPMTPLPFLGGVSVEFFIDSIDIQKFSEDGVYIEQLTPEEDLHLSGLIMTNEENAKLSEAYGKVLHGAVFSEESEAANYEGFIRKLKAGSRLTVVAEAWLTGLGEDGDVPSVEGAMKDVLYFELLGTVELRQSAWALNYIGC